MFRIRRLGGCPNLMPGLRWNCTTASTQILLCLSKPAFLTVVAWRLMPCETHLPKILDRNWYIKMANGNNAFVRGAMNRIFVDFLKATNRCCSLKEVSPGAAVQFWCPSSAMHCTVPARSESLSYVYLSMKDPFYVSSFRKYKGDILSIVPRLTLCSSFSSALG